MIGLGVFAGAIRPFHARVSKPGTPDSATVGTLGSNDERLAPVMAIARSLPPFTCGSAENIRSMTSWALPAITSAMAGALPLYGMWVIFTPAIELSSSVARCVDEPLPAEPKLIEPGLALAAAITSCTVL